MKHRLLNHSGWQHKPKQNTYTRYEDVLDGNNAFKITINIII